jgi:hypothetical protein
MAAIKSSHAEPLTIDFIPVAGLNAGNEIINS